MPSLLTPSRMLHRQRRCAFTLIELLVTMVIIAILAVLIFAALGRTKASAMDVKTLSNMRQTATAVTAYVQDHSNQLPGPLLDGQVAAYGLGATGGYNQYLGYYIYKYVGMPAPVAAPTNFPLMLDPSFRPPSPAALYNSKTFVMGNTTGSSGTKVRPFGRPASYSPDDSEPMPMAAVASITDQNGVPKSLSNIIMFHTSDTIAGGLPVRGDYGLAVYFDGHCGRIKPTTHLPF